MGKVYTEKQIHRWLIRLITKNKLWGYDWPTIRVVKPGVVAARNRLVSFSHFNSY